MTTRAGRLIMYLIISSRGDGDPNADTSYFRWFGARLEGGGGSLSVLQAFPAGRARSLPMTSGLPASS